MVTYSFPRLHLGIMRMPCFGIAKGGPEPLGRDSHSRFASLPDFAFHHFGLLPSSCSSRDLRSMNTKCLGNYILFMFANARKS